jgi:hypothetical protein
MKIFFATALIVGLAFTGFSGTTNEANNPAQTQPEELLTRGYGINAETFASNLKHLAGVKEGESNLQMLLRFFKQNGIEIKTPESIFLSEEKSKLFVRATEVHQHKIEQM